MLETRSPGGGRRIFRLKTGAALVATLAAGSLALAACSSGSSPSTKNTGSSTSGGTASTAPSETGSPSAAASSYAPATVTWGDVPIAGAAIVQIAETAGYFKDVNLTVKIEHASAINNVVPGVVSGTYNFGFQSGGGTAAAVAQGLPVAIVANAYFHDKEQEVMVKTGGPIKSIKDLKGKTIALGALNNNYQAGVIKILEDNGVAQSDVKMIKMPADQIAAAVESGQVAAGQINEPYIVANEGKLTALLDGLSPFGANAANAYVIVNTKWADDHKDVVTRFVTAVNRAQVLAASDRTVVETAVAQMTSIKPDLIKKMNMPGFGPDLKLDSEDQQQKLMFQLGFLKTDVSAMDCVYKGVDIVALSKQVGSGAPSAAASS